MDAAVHDEAVQQDEMRATVTRSSPSVDDASTRQTSELDDVARRVSEGYPNNKPMVSSSGASTSRRRGGALRTARFLLRKVATAGIAVVAVLIALVTWDQYNAGPWTRDGVCEFKLQVWRRRFPVKSGTANCRQSVRSQGRLTVCHRAIRF